MNIKIFNTYVKKGEAKVINLLMNKLIINAIFRFFTHL